MSLRVQRKALEVEPLQFQNKMLMENRDGKVMGLNRFFGLHQGPSRPQAAGRGELLSHWVASYGSLLLLSSWLHGSLLPDYRLSPCVWGGVGVGWCGS